jgi:hypothetical protein
MVESRDQKINIWATGQSKSRILIFQSHVQKKNNQKTCQVLEISFHATNLKCSKNISRSKCCLEHFGNQEGTTFW